MNKKIQNRNASIDLIRVISMFFVICVHVNPKPMEDKDLVQAILMTLLFTCNGCFFMMSGYFNINKVFNTKYDWIKYYGTRFISIIFPYLFVFSTTYVWNTHNANAKVTVQSYMIALFNEYSLTHLWYMYWLIGFIVSTPILSKAFHAMKDFEINIIFAICIIWNIVSVYISANNYITFSFNGWVLSAWAIYYFAGYYVHRMINDKNKKWLYLFGILGFFITVLGRCYVPGHFMNGHEYALAFVLFIMAYYYFIVNEIKIKFNWMKKILAFLSKYSFLVYLIHWTMLLGIIPQFDIPFASNYGIKYIEMCLLTLVSSLAAAIVIDAVIIGPCSKLMYMLLNKKLEKVKEQETQE